MDILYYPTKFEFDRYTNNRSIIGSSGWPSGKRRLLLDKKIFGSPPDSTLLYSCHSGGVNSHIQAHEV